MRAREIDFLENWVNKNVTVADRKGSQDRATELAAQCYADAAALGITIDDMEPEWGSVEEIIYDAMQDVGRRVRKLENICCNVRAHMS